MTNSRYFPITLLAAAILSGCNSVPKNASLSAAHTNYNEARNNNQISSLAAVELKDAGDSLSKADQALSKGEDAATVNHLAYIANQQVRIAQSTALRKTDEQTVSNAAVRRNEVRLVARTAEADAAKQQIAMVQQTADMQSEELAAASVNAERDQALIAKQEKQLAKLNAKKTDRGIVITLGDVLFSSGKSNLKTSGAHSIQKLADFLNQYPKHRVLIEGYTDSTGSHELNQELSEQRANSVRTALVQMGISSERITSRGYGEDYPISGNDTPSSRRLNRRVEIILSDENGNIATR